MSFASFLKIVALETKNWRLYKILKISKITKISSRDLFRMNWKNGAMIFLYKNWLQYLVSFGVKFCYDENTEYHMLIITS